MQPVQETHFREEPQLRSSLPNKQFTASASMSLMLLRFFSSFLSVSKLPIFRLLQCRQARRTSPWGLGRPPGPALELELPPTPSSALTPSHHPLLGRLYPSLQCGCACWALLSRGGVGSAWARARPPGSWTLGWGREREESVGMAEARPNTGRCDYRVRGEEGGVEEGAGGLSWTRRGGARIAPR